RREVRAARTAARHLQHRSGPRETRTPVAADHDRREGLQGAHVHVQGPVMDRDPRPATRDPRPATRDALWHHRYAKLVAACTFLLIAAGGMVTSTGSG